MKITESKDPLLFMALEKEVFESDPCYIPAEHSLSNRSKGFIAFSGETPIACCTAQLQTDNPTTGTIGHFVAKYNPEAVQQLFAKATAYLKSKGVQRIIAPMDGDTWHSYRFNNGPYTAPPFIKEPWNPPYYPELIESAGFTPIETYESYIVDDIEKATANQVRCYERCLRNGYTFEAINAKNFENLLPLIHKLSCSIFKDNVFYTPIKENEFLQMYAPAKPLIKNGLSWLARDADNNPAGYIFTFPDYADAIRAMNGKQNLMAKIRFLLARNKTTRTCIKTLGVLPEKRGSGLTAALTFLSYKNSAELGFSQTLMCLMHSANDSRKFGGKADRPYRSYTLYEYQS